MIKTRYIQRALTLLALSVSLNGMAAEWQSYSKDAFEQAKREGKSILIDFHADWCGTCKKQKPVLDSLLREPKFDSVVALSADYDKETELKKALSIPKQSSLVVFKGNKEMGRSLGMTDRAQIAQLIEKGL